MKIDVAHLHLEKGSALMYRGWIVQRDAGTGHCAVRQPCSTFQSERFPVLAYALEWVNKYEQRRGRATVASRGDFKPAYGSQQWAETRSDDLGESPDY